jgi:hypothetical protein
MNADKPEDLDCIRARGSSVDVQPSQVLSAFICVHLRLSADPSFVVKNKIGRKHEEA